VDWSPARASLAASASASAKAGIAAFIKFVLSVQVPASFTACLRSLTRDPPFLPRVTFSFSVAARGIFCCQVAISEHAAARQKQNNQAVEYSNTQTRDTAAMAAAHWTVRVRERAIEAKLPRCSATAAAHVASPMHVADAQGGRARAELVGLELFNASHGLSSAVRTMAAADLLAPRGAAADANPTAPRPSVTDIPDAHEFERSALDMLREARVHAEAACGTVEWCCDRVLAAYDPASPAWTASSPTTTTPPAMASWTRSISRRSPPRTSTRLVLITSVIR
jgi:hypothetical protein